MNFLYESYKLYIKWYIKSYMYIPNGISTSTKNHNGLLIRDVKALQHVPQLVQSDGAASRGVQLQEGVHHLATEAGP